MPLGVLLTAWHQRVMLLACPARHSILKPLGAMMLVGVFFACQHCTRDVWSAGDCVCLHVKYPPMLCLFQLRVLLASRPGSVLCARIVHFYCTAVCSKGVLR